MVNHSLFRLYEVDIAAQDIIDFTQLDATVESLVANNPLLCRPRSSCIPLPTTDDVNTAPLPLTTTLGGSNDKEEIIVVELEDWAELGRALVDACDRFAFDDNIDGEVSRRVNSLLAPIRIEIAKSNTAAGDASSISNGGNVEDVMMIDSTFDPDAAPVSQVILADNDNEGVTNIDAGSSKRKRIRNDMVSVLGGEEATRTAASGATATAASADGEKMAGNNEEEGNNDEEEQEEEEEDDDDEGGETTR